MICAKCGVEVVVCVDIYEPDRAVTLTAPVGEGGPHRPIRIPHDRECGKESITMQILAWIVDDGPRSSAEIREVFGPNSSPMAYTLERSGFLKGGFEKWVATQKGRDKVRAM